MKRLLIAAGVALLANAAAATETAETPILPGYWKYSVKAVSLVTMDSGRRCLKAEEISEFIAFPGNKHYRCSYPVKTVAGGRVNMEGACVDKKGRRAPIRASGTYSPEQFRLNVRLTTTNGIPLSGAMTAQRVSATCPA
jgi:hypothetical protein